MHVGSINLQFAAFNKAKVFFVNNHDLINFNCQLK